MLYKIGIAVLIILGFNRATVAQVQPSSNPVQPIQDLPAQQRADLEIMGLDSTVHLSEEQKAQLWRVFSSADNNQELIKTTNETDPDKIVQAKRELMQQKQDAVNSILTLEQRERLRNANWGTGKP